MGKIYGSQSVDTLLDVKIDGFVPVAENMNAPATESETAQYFKKVRQYFLKGKKTNESLPLSVVPVLLAPYLRGDILSNNYPALYDYKNNTINGLHDLLQAALSDIFESEGGEIMIEDFPKVALILQEKIIGKNLLYDYGFQVKEIVNAVREGSEKFENEKKFNQKCDALEKSLLSKGNALIGFSELSTFQILNLQIQKQNEHNQIFLKILKKSISGLNEILVIQTDEKDISKSHLDFAGDLVSFDKIQDLSMPAVSSNLSESRLNRLRNCYDTLLKAYDSYLKNPTTVFVDQELCEEFSLNETLKDASLQITSRDSGNKIKSFYNEEIKEFVKIISAIRISELEINQQYQAKLHDAYFDGFDYSYLSENDIKFFRSIILVEESSQLIQQPQAFLSLFSKGAHIKVLAINRLENLIKSGEEEEAEDTYLELASLAIFRRKAFVYQIGALNPSKLNATFHDGLEAEYPVLWNILLASPKSQKVSKKEYLGIKTAIESRCFPQVEYKILSGDTFISHFDINENSQVTQPFPTYSLETNTPSGKQDTNYALTIADFFSISSNNVEMLEIIPSRFQSTELIPLAEYLTLPQDMPSSKIPFIWLVDNENILRKAVIPIVWLRHCRNRLDYWQFLQEMGGKNNIHLQSEIDEAKANWEDEKENELGALKIKMQEEFAKTRTRDLEKAIQKMLNKLLGSDDQLSTLLSQQKISAPTLSVKDTNGSIKVIAEKPKEEVQVPTVEMQDDKKVAKVKSEVWVESDDCTSCSDCTDALPSVFKYNSNKQVYVHNAKGGPYAKIVAAAEKCPAMCIHPGLPHDKNEPNLEKLVKRAEKFN
jgi:ferredoxin